MHTIESDTFRPRARPRGSEFYRGRGTTTIGVHLILRHRDEVSYEEIQAVT